MPFTGPTEDRLAIRELYGSYADAAFSGDGAAWLALWADDCTWDTPMGKVTGRQALKAQWEGLWSRIETMAFFGEVAAIEADGDRARSRAYCREVSRWKDGSMLKVIGRYDDELLRTDGKWKFAHRTFTVHLQEA
jgi:ketosteroid isomerase-like protein